MKIDERPEQIEIQIARELERLGFGVERQFQIERARLSKESL